MRVAAVALFALTVVAPSRARAQAAWPDTPAGRRLAGWTAAFNAAGQDSLRRFLAEHAPGATGQSLLQATPGTAGFRAQTGGFALRKVESSAPTQLVALMEERGSDQVARFTIEVAPTPPHAIVKLGAQAIPRPPELAIARLDDAALPGAIRQRLERDAELGRFAGAVLVARQGRPVFEGAYGLADRERKVANTLDTRFRIGSMNKMFTAVATLQLVQAGKVRLDAPLGTYLPDYPNKDVASKVTIHHLLTHTGGTGNIFGPQFQANRLTLRTHDDYLKLYGERALAFEPGARWEYSNYGFVLLGAVIERVTGTSYYDYVARHVYAPAGMTASGSEPEESGTQGRSVGYTTLGPNGPAAPGTTPRPNDETLPWRGTAAGGGYSTVRDLGRFAEALRTHRLLDAKHTALLTTGKVDAGQGGRYAYGFMERTVGGWPVVGHGGGAPGMNGELFVDLASGTVVVALANMDPPTATRAATFIANRVTAGGATRVTP